MKHLFKAVTAACIALLFACNSPSAKKETGPEKDILVENMDTTVNPATDFFSYACGKWIKENPIPGNEKGWGIWTAVRNETLDRMKEISEDAAADKNAAKGSNAQKIGDFYFAGMDSAGIEQTGIKPLQGELDRINAINDVKGFLDVVALYHTYGVAPLFSAVAYQDEKNSEQVTLHFYQGGLGLPDRDYYFNTDERTKKIREEYPHHVAKMLELSGSDAATAKKQSEAIMKIETSLAKASRKIEDLRDPYKNYNKLSIEGVSKLCPTPDWKALLTAMNINNVDSIVVGQPEFYQQVEKELKSVSMDDWKAYLRWHLVSTFAPQLSEAFDKEHFRFFGTILSGVKEQRPRWKRVLDEQEGALGDALGQLYVQQYVSPSVKERYSKLTDDIFNAYRNSIKSLDWMSDTTKQRALVKLNSVMKKVSYPDKWKDYSKLEIDRGSYAMNVLRSNVWQFIYQMNKIGKPVDRTEWDMTPQTYNAYYNPSNNEIVLPAAIFIIPELPDSLADDAIIYGYAGASTIGHEITHGFDDQGRQFDEKGNLHDWWMAKDGEEYNQRAKRIINQFNNFQVLDSMHVNGSATQGENIADLGGVVLGLEAFKQTQQYKEGKKINGLTPVQRYFLGYALSWLGHFRNESIAMRLMTDVHSPNFLRINGPLANIPEFYEAFDVKPGDKMYMPDSLRVKIW